MSVPKQIESQKREGRVRVADEVKALPNDTRSLLIETTAAYRYPTQWSCAVCAMHIGLTVMRIQRDRLGELINSMEQTGTR